MVREEGGRAMVAADLLSGARAGDGEAFGELTEPYRRELQVHCYRMLGSVNSALKRARARLQARPQPAAGHQLPPAAGSPAEDAIMARFARAWESADLDALVAPLTGDVFVAMPEPFGYEGRDLVARYCARLFAAGRGYHLIPARANGQPAFGAYLHAPDGLRHATAFYVLTLAGHQIRGITRFEASVLPWFGLPRSLPARQLS